MKNEVVEPSVEQAARHEAINCIDRYKDPELDSTNEKHIQAYLLLRKTYKRIHPEKLKKVLQNEKHELLSSAAITTSYFLVPRSNFVKGGVPSIVKDNFVPKNELSKMEETTGENSDLSSVYVVDEACRRHLLGNGVGMAK